MSALSVNILGASGYAGGEFLRLALAHPHLRVERVTSRQHAGYPVHLVHPNLRGAAELRFTPPEALTKSDVLVSALPHGALKERLQELSHLTHYLVDLSSDFRPRRGSGANLATTNGETSFVYANPEINRENLRGATRLAGAGCIATAAVLALHPVRGLIDAARPVIIDAKIGSSASGSVHSRYSHHPAREGSMRSYAPTRHRHEAEIAAATGEELDVHLTATAVSRVRGVLATSHAFVKPGVTQAAVVDAFESAFGAEPFVRVVRERRGINRLPDPKILDGTNYCDVGFELDEERGRLVLISALDNLVKGTAGHALQALNIAAGLPEEAGLNFQGLHP